MIVELLVNLAPYGVDAGVRLYRSATAGAAGLWSAAKSAAGAMSSFVGALPEDWTQWNGARPELRGAPEDTILAYKGLEKLTPAERAALLDLAASLGIPVDSLAGIMSRESGFDTRALNPLPAAGLIQLTLGAHLQGFDTKEKIKSILDMPAIEQFEKVVRPYYERFEGKLKGANPGEIYMANFLPAHMGKPPSTVLGTIPPELVGKTSLPYKEWMDAWKEVKKNRKTTFPEAIYIENRGFAGGRPVITIEDVYNSVRSGAKSTKGRRMRIDGSIIEPGSLNASSAVSTLSATPESDKPVVKANEAKGTAQHTVGAQGLEAPARGILIDAVRRGLAVLPEWIEITLPSGLVVSAMRDAVKVPFDVGDGSTRDVRFPVSYLETIEACNILNALPLTEEVSNLLWASAAQKLTPKPLVMTAEDSAKMGRIEFVLKHHLGLVDQIDGPSFADVGKDWILSKRIAERPAGDGAVNYGWRQTTGTPLQPVGGKHDNRHYDYSQVLRVMKREGLFNGEPVQLLDRTDLWLPAGFPDKVLAPFRVGVV